LKQTNTYEKKSNVENAEIENFCCEAFYCCAIMLLWIFDFWKESSKYEKTL